MGSFSGRNGRYFRDRLTERTFRFWVFGSCRAADMKLLALIFVALSAVAQTTFTNPILPGGPDPWIVRDGGYYYLTVTTGSNLAIRKANSLAGLSKAHPVVVWKPPADGPGSKELWAPELHRIRGKWYLYYAADDGKNRNHRICVLENGDADPTTLHWSSKGRLTSDDHWAIDATVFEQGRSLYAIWSGWPGSVDGTQNLYIARMKNPWSVTGPRVLISTPDYTWEQFGDINDNGVKRHVNVNEGPEVLQHGGRVFVTYSASGCWTDHYALGMLTLARGGNPMNRGAWTKSSEPMFQGDAVVGVFSPGHNGFFTSPDGKESWIVYHANPAPGEGCAGHRSPRAQPFTWNDDGSPNFGKPVPLATPIAEPSDDTQ